MIIQVNKLPSNFKPYLFKSFKMKAMSLQQAIDLGKEPKLADIAALLQTLVGDEIDASVLVPVDVKFLLSMLAFHAYPKQGWTLDLTCPYCGKSHKRSVTIKDFPPVPSLSDDDPYPLTIDDGVHVWAMGYANLEATDAMIELLRAKNLQNKPVEEITKDMDTAKAIDLVLPYILSVDDSKEGIKEKLLSLEDFGVLDLMLEVIQKYFVEETYSEFECPECKKKYRVPMSAIEVTQYTPFPNKEATRRYKVNFRL